MAPEPSTASKPSVTQMASSWAGPQVRTATQPPRLATNDRKAEAAAGRYVNDSSSPGPLGGVSSTRFTKNLLDSESIPSQSRESSPRPSVSEWDRLANAGKAKVTESSSIRKKNAPLNSNTTTQTSVVDQQLALLNLNDTDTSDSDEPSTSAMQNAVFFSAHMLKAGIPPQYGLLGIPSNWNEIFPTTPADNRLFLNTNIPFSAFICGVQGSGKSHTTSCLIGE